MLLGVIGRLRKTCRVILALRASGIVGERRGGLGWDVAGLGAEGLRPAHVRTAAAAAAAADDDDPWLTPASGPAASPAGLGPPQRVTTSNRRACSCLQMPGLPHALQLTRDEAPPGPAQSQGAGRAPRAPAGLPGSEPGSQAARHVRARKAELALWPRAQSPSR